MPTSPVIPAISLNNGVEIPQLGLGVFQIEPDDTAEAVEAALAAGYRHIDTAEMYGNEKQVGEAVHRSEVPREEIFLTSKLSNAFHAPDDARRAFDQTLVDLGVDAIDLFLIHWPLATVIDFLPTWQVFEEFYRDGRARSIGVSNFQPHHLSKLFAASSIIPAVNQVEVHPYHTQDDVRAFDTRHQIATEAWSPIAQGKVLDDPTISAIGRVHGKSPAQVVLRWHIQLGNIVFPKSITPARMAENADIFDFQLDDGEMSSISGLDRGLRTGPDPDTFASVPS